MGTGQKRNQLVVPQAQNAMWQFKNEMASEVGITGQ
ncbi:MAG: small, acid-soluble spore protein, alpha/beta type, partial [Eubacteriales bacterium]